MNMIIQDIAEKLVKKICERAFSGEIRDLGKLASDVKADCEAAGKEVVEAIIDQLNLSIREDKSGRREYGLSVKEHDRTRTIYTGLGELHIQRDYFYDRGLGKCRFMMDEILGIPKYERVDRTVGAELAKEAADVSYARSSRIVTGGKISRQTVRNSILRVKVPEETVPVAKRRVKTLHIFADEDHVHMQKPDKERGKQSQIVPVVTVTEGIRSVGTRRNATIEPVAFVDEGFDTKRLWKAVEGYIEKTYDLDHLEKIMIHGDGGNWIRNGLEDFDGVVRVMDEFHFWKYLRALSSCFPKRNVKNVIQNAVEKNDREKADQYLQELMEKAEEDKKLLKKVKRFSVYLLNNWEPIVNRFQDEMTGSCTEGLVSHLLSERFSRDPMGWSKAGLGRLSHLRIYLLNGGKITAKDLTATKKKDEPQGTSLSAYADKVIEEAGKGINDWSIFDGKPYIFDGASGTQTVIRSYGRMVS